MTKSMRRIWKAGQIWDADGKANRSSYITLPFKFLKSLRFDPDLAEVEWQPGVNKLVIRLVKEDTP